MQTAEQGTDGAATEEQSYRLFDTAFGVCGVAWSARGLTRVQLAEADAAATERRLAKGGARPGKPPPAIAAAVAVLKRYFEGEEAAFDTVALDLPTGASAERRRIYAAARALRWGETASYGEVAKRAGLPGGARAVGQAMAANPLPIVIPCHRVLAAGDRPGGFSAYGGIVTKERLLVLERVRLDL